MHVLVLHGPNLNLLGAKLDSINAALLSHAKTLGFELEVFQANSEGALIDELHRRREWLNAVIVNPASLAPVAYALAEALQLINKKCIEVQLVTGRTSVLREAVEAQLHGDEAVYEAALDTLAGKREAEKIEEEEEEDESQTPKTSSRLGKSIGRKPSALASAASPPQATRKTIGRTSAAASPQPASNSGGSFISRALVKAQVQARLSGTLSADALASWARAQWQALNGGNSQIETGQKDMLEDVLLSLSASAKANDHLLLAAVAKLDRAATPP